MENERMVFVGFNAPLTLDQEVRHLAAERRVSRTAVIRDALAAYLRQHQQRPTNGNHEPARSG